MPRYYFDIATPEYDQDKWGAELEDADAARVRAIGFAGTYLRDHPEFVWDGSDLRVRVREESGRILFKVLMLSVNCQLCEEGADS